MAAASVLVVDDDEGFRTLISEVLARAGYSVLEASSGEEALAAAVRERPTVVLVDVRLGDISGYDVCRQLRADFGEHLPILFVSGERTEPFDRVAGLRLGGDDYLVKPLDPAELLARVDRIISRDRGAGREPPGTPFHLTRRELQILGLLAEGSTAKDIGQELSISRKTVGTHVQSILGKLGVHSQAQAISVAFRTGIFESSSDGREPKESANRVPHTRASRT
jgi:two-component system nitrate/nitrite response regulator NarL